MSSERIAGVGAGRAARARPPRALNVVRNPRPEEVGVPIDWSAWYLTDEEDMGEGNEQSQIIVLLRTLLEELAREQDWTSVYIGSDQFFAWVKDEPNVRVSPDVYVLDDPPPPPLPRSWQTWRTGHRPPRFAVEIVSAEPGDDRALRKDYDDTPEKYAQLGTSELVIFDPEAASGRTEGEERVALQVYRREPDGRFVRAYRGAGPVRLAELDTHLVVVRDGPVARLRLARDEAGQDLVPTAAEARDAAELELARLRAEMGRQTTR